MQRMYVDEDIYADVKAAAALTGLSVQEYVRRTLGAQAAADVDDPDTARATLGQPPRIREQRRTA